MRWLKMIDYIALGISMMAVIICFIIHSKTSNLRKLMDEEIKIRKVQDDKLYYLIDFRLKEQQRVRQPQPSYFNNAQPQQKEYPDTFNDLINADEEEQNNGSRKL